MITEGVELESDIEFIDCVGCKRVYNINALKIIGDELDGFEICDECIRVIENLQLMPAEWFINE